MARQVNWKPRLIYPTCTTSASLNSKSALVEVLWWRLIACADDQGRLSGVPKSIKTEYVPFRPEIILENIPKLLDELKEDMIAVYGNPPVIQILTWWDWEHPQWALPSFYPAMKDWIDHYRYCGPGRKIITLNWPPPSPKHLSGQLDTTCKAPTEAPARTASAAGSAIGGDQKEEEEEEEEEKEDIVASQAKTTKPFYQEAKVFLDTVASRENVKLLNFAKLIKQTRSIFVATKAPVEDLLDCYTRMRADTFWHKLTPPTVILKIGDQFPTYLKLKQEGKLEEFLKPETREQAARQFSKPGGSAGGKRSATAAERETSLHKSLQSR